MSESCASLGRRSDINTADIVKTSNGAKKADVAKHPKVFHHVGLLVNEPPALAGCSLYSQPKTSLANLPAARGSFTRTACHVFYHNYTALAAEHKAIRH